MPYSLPPLPGKQMWRKRNGRRAGKYEREKKERGDSCEKTTGEIAGGTE